MKIKQAAENFGVSRTTITRLLLGDKSKKKYKEIEYNYKYEPLLIKDTDYIYNKGLQLTATGIKKLKIYFNK
jgi:predicted DNA-binding protein (UPF0251 family)